MENGHVTDAIVTASSKRIDNYVRIYGGFFLQDLRFSWTDMQVFFYLFDTKVHGPKSSHSAYQIFRELQANQIANNFANVSDGKRTKIKPRAVNESIRCLVEMKWVNTSKPQGEQKAGRPPDALYELKSVQEITDLIEKGIEEKRRNTIGKFMELSNIEENKGMISQGEGS